MPAIFISHSSLDNDLTAEVAAWLSSIGYADVFLDYDKNDGIAIGANWKGTLAAAMQRCHVVLLLVSENWFASHWCQSEHGTAALRGKELLPVLIRAPEPEHGLAFAAKVQQAFPDLQIADLTVDRETALRRLDRAIGGSEPTPMAFPVPPGMPPYRGLVSYDTAARGLYFGRDVEVQAALERLRQLASDGAGQVLIILGASGAGKSSMLRAGLWPQLQLRKHEFTPLEVVTLSPDPLRQRNMALAIADAVVGTLASASVRFDRDSLDGAVVSVDVGVDSRAALKATLETEIARLRKLSGSSTSTVIFALDQAEVLLQAPMPEARALCMALSVVLKIPNTLAVVTMRSDSFDQVLERRLLEGLELSVLPLPPLPISRLREVIREPARRVGIQVDGDLLDAMVADVGMGDALPLLSVTLEALWKHYGVGARFTRAQYDARAGDLGGRRLNPIENAAKFAADEAVGELDEGQRLALVDAFVPQMVELGPGGEFVRRRAQRSAMPAAAIPLLQRLEEARLITSSAGGLIEVTHEALLRRWPLVSDAVEAAKPDLGLLMDVERSANEWSTAGRRSSSLVHDGSRLKRVSLLARRPLWRSRFSELGLEYLDACGTRATRDLKRAIAAMTAVALLAAVAWVYMERSVSWHASLALAGAAEAAAEQGYFDQSFRLAMLAARADLLHPAHPVARPALVRAASGNALRLLLAGHTDTVLFASYSPDARRIVTVSDDKTARIWDAETGQALGQSMKHDGAVKSANFSLNSRRIVTASDDKTARVWDADTGKALCVPLRHDDPVVSASFDVDGTRVVTASGEVARVWNVEVGKALGQPIVHQDHVRSARFSDDGKLVITESDDPGSMDQPAVATLVWDANTGAAVSAGAWGEAPRRATNVSPDGERFVIASGANAALIQDAKTGKPLGEPMRHDGYVRSASFSPDGSRVVTASDDKNARVWDARTGLVAALGEPTSGRRFNFAELSPDGKRVVLSSSATSARLWDVQTGKAIGEPMKHDGEVTAIHFGRNGKRVVTVSADKIARVWDGETGKTLGVLIRHDGSVVSASFRADGMRILTASNDTARVWDTDTGKLLVGPMKHDGLVVSAEFNTDGRRIITASSDKAVRVWDADTGRLLSGPMRHDGGAQVARLSRDGRHVVVASDKTVRVWDVQTGRVVGEPMEHDWFVSAVSFSPDGNRVVTAWASRARLWDAKTGLPSSGPMKHDGRLWSASFSPDSKKFVTASGDGTARVWDVETGKVLGEPIRHGDGVRVESAKFSSDGARIVTVSSDGTARIWQETWSTIDDIEALEQAACGRMNAEARRITKGDLERAKLIPPQRLGEDVCGWQQASVVRAKS